MRKTRLIENCQGYHLISRQIHQAFLLDDDEKTRRGYAFIYGNADDWDVIRDCQEKSMREAMSEILACPLCGISLVNGVCPKCGYRKPAKKVKK